MQDGISAANRILLVLTKFKIPGVSENVAVPIESTAAEEKKEDCSVRYLGI